MITLVHSATTLELPNPQMGDSRVHMNRSVSHRSMNGTLWAWKKPINFTVNWSFENVDRDKIKEIEAFFRDKKGRVFAITDHHGDTWNGVLARNMQSTDNSRGRCVATAGNFSLSFQSV